MPFRLSESWICPIRIPRRLSRSGCTRILPSQSGWSLPTPTTRGQKDRNLNTFSDRWDGSCEAPGRCSLMAGVPARKRSDFMPVSAHRHRAPAPAVRTGGVVEKQPASGIGAQAQTRPRAFGNDFGGRARDGRKQPLRAAFACNELNFPVILYSHQLVVPFRDAENLVNRVDPFPQNFLLPQNRLECQAQASSKPLRLPQQQLSSLRVGAAERSEFPAAFGGYNSCGLQEFNELIPGQFVALRDHVSEVEGQSAANEPQGGLMVGHNLCTLS